MIDRFRNLFRQGQSAPSRAVFTPGGPEKRILQTSFDSRYLTASREIFVYLPHGYDQTNDAYPVLYMQDGQNLFDDSRAYLGKSWRVIETADALIESGAIEPLIIVGISNAGERRIDEYTPTRDLVHRRGGHIARYGWFLIEELKPVIDLTFRTASGRSGVGGSSLGGLTALFIGSRYPNLFPNVAALSPAIWWDRSFIVDHYQRLAIKPAIRIWLDIGTAEGDAAVVNARLFRDALESKGWVIGKDLAWTEELDAVHDEHAWGRRSDPMLRFLYPGKGVPNPRVIGGVKKPVVDKKSGRIIMSR